MCQAMQGVFDLLQTMGLHNGDDLFPWQSPLSGVAGAGFALDRLDQEAVLQAAYCSPPALSPLTTSVNLPSLPQL